VTNVNTAIKKKLLKITLKKETSQEMQLCPGWPVNKINKLLRKKVSVHARISKTQINYLAHFIFKVLCAH